MQDDGRVVGEIRQRVQWSTNVETSTHVSAQVRRFLNLYTPLLPDHLLNVGYVSVFHRQTHESILMWCECDRQFSESGSPVPNPFLNEDLDLAEDVEPPLVLDSGKQALQRLISCTTPGDELASLIGTVFSSGKVSDIIGCLAGDDAQSFIDVMDEVCCHASHLRRTG